MSFLDELFAVGPPGGGAAKGGDAAGVPLEQQVEALSAMAARVSAACPFKAGDLVTVRKGMDVRGAGKLHVVVEVLSEPVVDRSSEPGSNRYLNRYTMRVAHFCGADMTIHAVSHEVFEPWSEDHAELWRNQESENAGRTSRRLKPDVPLGDVVRVLREEGRRMQDAKISWKKGELVEILGYETSNAARPMLFGGRSVGLVETVDFSDETTRVVYFDDSGQRRAQWFRPIDLKPYTALEPVSA